MSKDQIVNKDDLVVRFAGDSGDGMQLSGTLFSDASALTGNDIATFPDYPAEIRAPHNTIAGVSGYQVHVGNHIYSSGDKCDILVAMNPASFKSNLKWAKKGASVIVDIDTFTDEAMEKAGYKENPFTDEMEHAYTIIKAPITSFTARIGQEQGADKKTADKCRNMFALGIIFYMTHKKLDQTFAYLERKFAKKPDVIKLNKAVLSEGYEYADKLGLAIDGAYDAVLMVDNDVTPPRDALLNLLSHDVDFVSGYYLHRNANNMPGENTCACRLYQPDGELYFNYPLESEYTGEELHLMAAHGQTLLEVHGGGMGCALIKTDVFRRLAYPWFDWVNYGNGGVLSEDLFFCERMRKADIPRYVDTRVSCGHLFRRIVTA